MRSDGWMAALACPRCHGDLTGAEESFCGRCGRVGRAICDRVIDFGVPSGPAAAAVVAWPDRFVDGLQAWADRLAVGEAAGDPGWLEDLRRYGLAGAENTLTALGETVRYHLDEYRWQKGRKGLDGVLELSAIGSTVRALDIGCGAGQTLRRLEPDRPVALFGVDCDAVALTLGARLARAEGTELTLAAASATALPFRESGFDLVLTRVALNYVHQRSALREMVRVLRPGGFLFCRVENIWHDLNLLRLERHPKERIGRMRDLVWGATHAVTGWQPAPGRRWSGSRVFASAWRMRRNLSAQGCRISHATESPNGPLLAGRRTQSIFVARKET